MRRNDTIVASSDQTMSKKRPRAPKGDEEPSGASKPISYRPSKEVAKALEEFRASFVFPPDKSAVIERALREFLIASGAMKKD